MNVNGLKKTTEVLVEVIFFLNHSLQNLIVVNFFSRFMRVYVYHESNHRTEIVFFVQWTAEGAEGVYWGISNFSCLSDSSLVSAG